MKKEQEKWLVIVIGAATAMVLIQFFTRLGWSYWLSLLIAATVVFLWTFIVYFIWDKKNTKNKD